MSIIVYVTGYLMEMDYDQVVVDDLIDDL
ncbi:hypothetical protein A2U01_0052957, partial [Trifolium medium]|nr:hypothetical protein [Trifolium medium]